MMVIAFSTFLVIGNVWLLAPAYILFAALGAPAMPQLYASARESINAYRSSLAVMANTVLRSMFSFGFLFGPLIGSVLLGRSEEHTSELQSRFDLVCRLLLEKKKD